MTASPGYVAFLEDQLAPLGAVRVRRMFGGGGVFCDDVMFALVAGDVLYFKANDRTRAAYEAEGQGPFVYQGKSKPITMSYWRVPERLFDAPDELLAWAREALDIAQFGPTPVKRKTSPNRARSKR